MPHYVFYALDYCSCALGVKWQGTKSQFIACTWSGQCWMHLQQCHSSCAVWWCLQWNVIAINASRAGCALHCSVLRVLLWLLMQWGSAEASPSGGGVEGKLWVCRWRCFLQLQKPFKFVHFNKGKQSRPWWFCLDPQLMWSSSEVMVIYKCTVP